MYQENIKSINKQLFYFVLILTTTIAVSCVSFQEIKINNVSNVTLKGINNNVVTFDITASIENPNAYRIKVKPLELKVMIGDQTELGKVKSMDHLVIAKKSTKDYTISVPIEITNMLSLGSAFSMFSGKTPDLRLTGKIRANNFWYGKTFELNGYKLTR
jgi:LEA14-like dessication related protein